MSNGDTTYELASVPKKKMGRTLYVAPDPDAKTRKDLGAEEHFNTLAIVPQYKIELRLGDIDDLFPYPVDVAKTTDTKNLGRKQRLQGLGLFYRPVNHTDSDKCYEVVWDHYKKKLHANLADAAAYTKLKEELQKHVVETGKLPKPDKSVKIRLPGGYRSTHWWTARAPFFKATELIYDMASNRYTHETGFFTANSVLGRLPLVVRVTKKLPDGKWEPAPGVSVYFQLRPPKDIPAHDTTKAPNQQVTAPELRKSKLGTGTRASPQFATGKGPFAYNDKRSKYDYDATDPQGYNAHLDMGGRRKMKNASGDFVVCGKDPDGKDNIFRTEEQKGFNVKHDSRDLPHKDYHAAHEVTPDGEKHKHCVRTTTNDDGEAGVIFQPSRVGGDSYRIRAYVGPSTLESDGTEEDAVVVETGNMIVWRTIHLSRYIRHAASANISNTIYNEMNAYYGGGFTKAEIEDWLLNQDNRIRGGVGLVDCTDMGTTDATFEGLSRQYSKSYCEFVREPQVTLPETLSAVDWAAAMNHAINVAGKLHDDHAVDVPIDARILFFVDPQSPFTFNMHSPVAYDAAGGPGMTVTGVNASAADRNLIWWIFYVVQFEFHKKLARDGFLPGLTLIQGPMGATWDVLGETSLASSGVGVNAGCYLWYGNYLYNDIAEVDRMPYNLSANASHEMGHSLIREHAPGGDAGGAQAAYHDADDVCVMSYEKCEGQYCGQCIGALAGFDTRAAKFQNPT